MNRRTKLIATTGAVAAAAIAVGSGIAVASGTEEDDPPIPQGTALDRATEVALKEAGGGTVSGSEQDDGGYEVEVTREDGSVLEVELDADFNVTDSEVDDDDGDDEADDDADEAERGQRDGRRRRQRVSQRPVSARACAC